MDRKSDISVVILQQALEAKKAEKRAVEQEIEQLEGGIRKLQSILDEFESANSSLLANENQALAAIVDRQQRIADNREYPFQKLQGLTRIDVAKAIARDFGGYLTTYAFRKILADSGVLRSTNQVGSVASRLLVNSEDFERISEGLYRLKGYGKE